MIIVPFCKCIVITREFKKEDGYVGVGYYSQPVKNRRIVTTLGNA